MGEINKYYGPITGNPNIHIVGENGAPQTDEADGTPILTNQAYEK